MWWERLIIKAKLYFVGVGWVLMVCFHTNWSVFTLSMLRPPPSSLPQALAKEACTKILECGHPCGGILDEDPCLPCLHRCRPSDQGALKQDADDMCMICFTEALSAAPAIYLKCGHVFHLHCTRMVLEKRWVGPRITFGFSLCPICKVRREEGVVKIWWGLVDIGYSQV